MWPDWDPLITDYKSAAVSIALRARRGSSIGCASARCADGRRFDPHVRQNILSLSFGHEKGYTTILSLPLIQEGRLSGERMSTTY